MRSKSRSRNVGRRPLFPVQPQYIGFVHFRLVVFCPSIARGYSPYPTKIYRLSLLNQSKGYNHIYRKIRVSEFDSVEDGRASIQIYTYREGIQRSLAEIGRMLDADPKGIISRRVNREPDRTLLSTFEFTRVDEDGKRLIYSVRGKRQIPDAEEPIPVYHDICFTSMGFLIVTGMNYRPSLIKCMTEKLHPNRSKAPAFIRKYLNRADMQKFVKKFLKPDINRIYRPRFHSSLGYRMREFNDFSVVEDKCATNDQEYESMLANCHYFDPIFKVNEICGEPLQREGMLRVHHMGYFYYSSRRITFEAWLKFISTYLPWCLKC